MWHTHEFFIPKNHASAAGHFPGDPIVPGALLLDAILVSIIGEQDEIVLSVVKCLRTVRFGTLLQLRWQRQGGQWRFECLLAGDGMPVLLGRLAPASVTS